MSRQPADGREVALGIAFAAARAGAAAWRATLTPGRVVLSAPVLGHVLRRAGDDLAADGRRAEAWARARFEEAVQAALAAPEFERAVDRALAGQLTDAVARSLAEHRVVERVAAQVVDERFLQELTERVLQSPEMDRFVEYVATSPQVIDAISHHTQTLADEMVGDVRRRTHGVDDAAERLVRGWLRRPRPSTP